VISLVSILIFLSSVLPPTTEAIEVSFLQNNPRMLYKIFSSQSSITISLPEPISFSDQLSHQQAYFLFRKIFSSYLTFEFYSESELPLTVEETYYIFKARWSFKNKKNNNQYVFHIFIYLIKEPDPSGLKLLSNRSRDRIHGDWKIIEIKAEKI
jgi:hypothetical protein